MLVGEHVRLRLVENDDLSLLVAWRNDAAIWAGFFNKFPLSMAGQKDWFARLVDNQEQKLFMICLLEKSDPIGTIGLNHIDFANQSVELGNVLIGRDEHSGRGHATEALELLLRYCFLRLNMNRVYLQVYAHRNRAIALYKHCGFQVEGTLREARFEDGTYRDVLIMSILRREFTSGPA
jgi:RimJ/RimL family protein N-acetyltransferase